MAPIKALMVISLFTITKTQTFTNWKEAREVAAEGKACLTKVVECCHKAF